VIPQATIWIWTATLVVVSFVVVPLAIVLLHRTLDASRAIERYTREALEAGVGIANNTAAISELETTIQTATSLLGAAESLGSRTATIKQAVTPKG